MAVCAANMRSCDRKVKCIFGPNEGEAYNPKDPCCGVGSFNPETCDCDLASGVYRIGVTISQGVDTGAFRYSYFTISPDYFYNGRPVRETLSIGVDNWSNRDDVNVGNQGCYDAGQCSNLGSEGATAFAVYMEPCWFTAPESTYIYRPDLTAPNGMAAWWTPPEYGTGICPAVCAGNADYNAPTGLPWLRIFSYYSDNNQYLNERTYKDAFEPPASRLNCQGNLRVFYSTDGPEFVGPGDLTDYFESTSERPVYSGTAYISSDEVFEPDFLPPS